MLSGSYLAYLPKIAAPVPCGIETEGNSIIIIREVMYVFGLQSIVRFDFVEFPTFHKRMTGRLGRDTVSKSETRVTNRKKALSKGRFSIK